MLAFLQKHADLITLIPFLLLGLALGHLAGTGSGLLLQPSLEPVDLDRPRAAAGQVQKSLEDFTPILQRNVFNSAGPAQGLETRTPETTPASQPAAPARQVPLSLVGTITAGPASLAVIEADGTVERYGLGEEVPGGATVQEINRTTVRIEYGDGRSELLTLFEEDRPSPPAERQAARGSASARTGNGSRAAAGSTPGLVREAGENRYVVDRAAVDAARKNMNQLLQQARMEPYIVGGETRGFEVKWIQRNSLLGLLGLRPGDVVVEVNNVELDSPEKALAIFQQLREARTLSVGLIRNGDRKALQYEFQ